MTENTASKDFERTFLRGELETNKKFVFERALLIAAAGFGATLFPDEAKGIGLLGFPIIGALAFNFWISTNRLLSSSRILAYYQLFHESVEGFNWIGWENSLRLYRIWRKHEKFENERCQAETEFEKTSEYDHLSFYRPILALNIATAFLIAGLMSFRIWSEGPLYTPVGPVSVSVMCSFNLATAVVFSVWAPLTFRPKRLENAVEKELVRWKVIHESFEHGELKGFMNKGEIIDSQHT